MWLVSAQKASEGDENGKQLFAAREDSKQFQLDLKSAQDREQKLREMLATLTADRDQKSKTVAELEARYRSLDDKKRILDKLLEDRLKQLKEVEAVLGTVREENTALTRAARENKADLLKKVEDLNKRAEELTRKLATAEKLAAKLSAAEGEVKTLRGKLDAETLVARATKAELERLKKEHEQLSGMVEGLKQEKERLLKDIARIRAPLSDNRFSGISLTGKRVIFLVDTSGSMEMVDEKTPAPTKWAEVRNSVMKIMRSLPDLEKFQLITFGEEISFPLGKQGEWFDYDAKTSATWVGATLGRIKPKGGTNMFKPMEAAFRYRARGLDTLYLFSDGLPNEGEGLTPEQDKNIKDETQRSTLLGKFIRRKLENDWNRRVPGKDRVRINAVGFFFESPDLGAFLWALARENEGSFVGMSKP
jgi:hypothetical protein